MKTKHRINIPMCAACILLCLTLLSIHFTSGLYARYVTRSSSSDDARVAAFGQLTLTETGDFYEGNKLMIIPGVDLNKKATVSWTPGEVSVYIFVEVETPLWLTADNRNFYDFGSHKMTWAVDNNWQYLTQESDGTDTTYIYYKELEPGEALAPTDVIKDGKILVPSSITAGDLSGMNHIKINIRASVVQSGGFTNATAAWNSLKTH